jgi:hypothetical protein
MYDGKVLTSIFPSYIFLFGSRTNDQSLNRNPHTSLPAKAFPNIPIVAQ